MTEPNNLMTAQVSLVLDPAGVKLDGEGRIRLADARVLSALLTGRPALAADADDTNYALCGGNGYCPKTEDPGSVVVRPGG